MTLGMVVITPDVIRYEKNPLVMDVRLPAQTKMTGDPGGTEGPDQPSLPQLFSTPVKPPQVGAQACDLISSVRLLSDLASFFIHRSTESHQSGAGLGPQAEQLASEEAESGSRSRSLNSCTTSVLLSKKPEKQIKKKITNQTRKQFQNKLKALD